MSSSNRAPNAGSVPQAAVPVLDVFISYAREDRECAQWVATGLLAAGQTVWWDRQLAGGQDFGDAIAQRLAEARLVLVLWSSASVASGFVRDESARARDAGKLLPVRIDDVPLPLGFGTLHTLDLLDWDGDSEAPAFAELLANVKRGAAGLPAGRGLVQRHWLARWRKPLLLLTVVVALALGGGFGWSAWRQQQALAQFQQGLSAQFARDRNLQAARNSYLNALQINPALGRAHYYLAHVYALLILPRDARTQFDAAIRFGTDLDPGQLDDARVQLASLDVVDEAAPVSREVRSVSAAAADPAPPQAVVRPAPMPTPTPSPSPAAPPAAPIVGAAGADRPSILARRPSVAPAVAAAAAPAKQLPRVAPSPEQQRRIDAQVDELFAPQLQKRLEAATAVALNPETLSDALPLALARAVRGLKQQPADDATIAGATNTLQLLLSASPATLNANHGAVLQLLDAVQPLGENQRATAKQARTLLDKAAAAARPVVFIQIADDAQRALAQDLAQRIRAAGYEVPGIEKVGARAPSRSEVRVQDASIQGWGRWLQKIVGDVAGEPAQLNTLRAAKPAVDTYEIWLDKALCTTPQRQPPGC